MKKFVPYRKYYSTTQSSRHNSQFSKQGQTQIVLCSLLIKLLLLSRVTLKWHPLSVRSEQQHQVNSLSQVFTTAVRGLISEGDDTILNAKTKMWNDSSTSAICMCGPAWRRVEYRLEVQGKTNRQLLETSVVLLHLIESVTKFDWYSHSYQFFPFGSLVLCVYDRDKKNCKVCARTCMERNNTTYSE